jgi:hypothetical protein
MLRNKIISSRKLMYVALFSHLLFTPVPVIAESVTFIKAAEQQQFDQLSPKISSLSNISISLDEEGNGMIRYGKLSVSFLNDAGRSPVDKQVQPSKLPSLQDMASIGGLNVRLEISF